VIGYAKYRRRTPLGAVEFPDEIDGGDGVAVRGAVAA